MPQDQPDATPTSLDLTRSGRIIGMLLLGLLVTGLITPYVVLRPLTAPPAGFLENAAAMESRVRLSVLMLLVGGLLTVAISVAAWPVVRERSPRLALWVLVLAAGNLILQIIENAHWLWMLSMSQAYAAADPAAASLFPSLGLVVRTAWRWAHYSHILVVVGWLFLLFCLVYRCRLAPRPLAAFGMAVCVLHFTGITLPAFAGYRMPMPELFGMPLALAILMLGGWLIPRGFRQPAPAGSSA